MSYNSFGALPADVIAMYPGSQASDYAGPFGVAAAGTAVVQAAMDRATRIVAGLLTPLAFRMMIDPELELVERMATANQTQVTLGINAFAGYAGFWPLHDTNNVHIWTGQPLTMQVRPRLRTDVMSGIGMIFGSNYGFGVVQTELDATAFSVVQSTGVVTLNTPLNVSDQVFASYRVDVESASFQMPSLADMVRLGAAVELGAMLFSSGDQSWDLVKQYKERWDMYTAAEKEGTLVPDEIRRLRHFRELDRRNPNGIQSVRRYRGGGGGEIGGNGWTDNA